MFRFTHYPFHRKVLALEPHLSHWNRKIYCYHTLLELFHLYTRPTYLFSLHQKKVFCLRNNISDLLETSLRSIMSVYFSGTTSYVFLFLAILTIVSHWLGTNTEVHFLAVSTTACIEPHSISVCRVLNIFDQLFLYCSLLNLHVKVLLLLLKVIRDTAKDLKQFCFILYYTLSHSTLNRLPLHYLRSTQGGWLDLHWSMDNVKQLANQMLMCGRTDFSLHNLYQIVFLLLLEFSVT